MPSFDKKRIQKVFTKRKREQRPCRRESCATNPRWKKT